MRAIAGFVVLIIVILLLGSLLAWPLYALTSAFSKLGFDKYVHYSMLLTGLILCLIYLKTNHQLGEMFAQGHASGTRARQFLTALIFGIMILIIVESLLFLLGMRTLDPRLQAGGLWGFSLTLIKALLTGIIVGLLEETIYRGAIHSGLEKYANTFYAMIISSLFYASVHFIDFGNIPPATDMAFLDGPSLLLNGLDRFADPHIYDAFITLFFLGILLSLMRHRNGTIIACIGLHAGVVMMIKIFTYSTDYQAGSQYEFLINNDDKSNGWLASVCLIIACLVFYYGMRIKDPPLQQ